MFFLENNDSMVIFLVEGVIMVIFPKEVDFMVFKGVSSSFHWLE